MSWRRWRPRESLARLAISLVTQSTTTSLLNTDYGRWKSARRRGSGSCRSGSTANGVGSNTKQSLRVADSGGHVLYLTPGLQVVIGSKWVLEASFQQAVQHDLDGTQTGETYKISGGITYLSI